MHKDKMALVKTMRAYCPQHILSHLFQEAADTIEEQLRIIDAISRDNDQLCAQIEELTAGKDSCPITTAAKPGHWIFLTIENDPQDPVCVFQHRYECSVCHTWQSYGMTKYCPNCGKPMQEAPEAHDCHNCKHRTRDMGRECQSCLDAGDFPLWEEENG